MNEVKNQSNKKSGNYERIILFFVLLGGLPSLLSLLLIAYLEEPSKLLIVVLIAVSFVSWISLAFIARKQIFYPLYTISNLLESLREGDYSLRGTRWDQQDGLGDIIREINTLSETLRLQRIEAEEASALLRKVVANINVSVFAFDENLQLKFLNPAAEVLLGKPASYYEGKSAAQMHLEVYLQQDGVTTVKEGFGSKRGHWQVVHQHFRDDGYSNHLLVISDIARAVRGEERKAWKDLIRVLGHELNNSLTPIQSIAATLNSRLTKDGLENVNADDFASGLSVINNRAEALSRFVSVYSKLAKLPEPTLAPVAIRTLLQRIVDLQMNQIITLLPGPDIKLQIDSDQIEQLLINILRNALEAMDENSEVDIKGEIEIAWREEQGKLHLLIRDEGPGIANTDNLFVPFYTTKENGSGIGLVLCQQIAEAHDGQLTLENRIGHSGCEARLILPIKST